VTARSHSTPPRPSWAARLARSLLIAAVLIGTAIAAGFAGFVSGIPATEKAVIPDGDAIVVLTGAAERIGDAIDILAEGHAKRLLISGVNPDTTKDQLARLHPRAGRWLDCCVDLGFRALNTAGNAAETRQWVRRYGFESLIVVTSGWHMPRSLLEMQRTVPEVILLPYPVVTGNSFPTDWWRQPDTVRLLVGEYVKYLAALVEVRLQPRLADDEGHKT
jgi:uncharacterized SAM-binding protein YcdF (DUF218 family)